MVGGNSRSLRTPCAAESLQYNLHYLVRREMLSYRLHSIGSYVKPKGETPQRRDRFEDLPSYCHTPGDMDASRIL